MLKIVAHLRSKGRPERRLHWLFWVIEQMLDQFVPGGEALAICCVHPLHWRLENLEDKVSIKSLVSEFAGYVHTALQFSYTYRGIVALHAWLSKGVFYAEDHETRRSNPSKLVGPWVEVLADHLNNLPATRRLPPIGTRGA